METRTDDVTAGPAPEVVAPLPRKRDRALALIAVFKFLQATLFVLLGLGALHLLRPGVVEQVQDWSSTLTLGSGQRLLRTAVAMLSGLSRARIGALGIGGFLYASLFLTEGVGLWLERRWAQYLTVVATAALIPIEVYEVARRLSVGRIAALVVNVVVVLYLVARLRPRTAPAELSTEPTA